MSAPADSGDWTPTPSFGMLREMARAFGGIVTRPRKGATKYGLKFVIDGVAVYSWSCQFGRRWVSYSSRELAEMALDEIRSDIRRGVTPIAAVSPYVKSSKLYQFGKFWEEWTTYQKKRAGLGEITNRHANVVAGYEQCGYLEPIWTVSIFTLDFGYMETLKDHLLSKVAPKTAHNVLSDVRTCLRWVARRRGMPKAPEIPSIRVPVHIPTIPSLEEQEALLEAIPWEIRGYWLARGLLGVRDAEAARAELADYRRREVIDEDGNVILKDEWRIRAKGERDRLLPVPIELAIWVRANRPALAEAGTLIFVNPKADRKANPHQRWKHRARSEAFHRAAKAIGCEGKWKPNEALRHCFGTRTAERLLLDGNSQSDAVRMIMSIMGHTSTETSMRYVKLGAEALRGALGE